jgi:hypothetical protein
VLGGLSWRRRPGLRAAERVARRKVEAFSWTEPPEVDIPKTRSFCHSSASAASGAWFSIDAAKALKRSQ